MDEQFDTVVIGAGQAGLAAGYHLAARGLSFVIVEGSDRVGGSWWHRWDSLRLFTPINRDSLPGMRFRGEPFPDCAAVTGYLTQYAEHFRLPVRTGVRVDGVFDDGNGYLITSGITRIHADSVVIATGVDTCPRLPDFASLLDPAIVQMHSIDYRNDDQLASGDVLVVGAGNSGADIALDVVGTHRVHLSGRHPGHIPWRTETWANRHVGFPVMWFLYTHLLTLDTPLGRRVLPKVQARTAPLIRVKPADLDRANIPRVPRTVGVVNGRPQLDDGRVLDVANVIWCTGFKPNYPWLSLDGLPTQGALPTHHCEVDGHPGLFVLGQEFQPAFNSHTIGGVGRDAALVARQIAAHHRHIFVNA